MRDGPARALPAVEPSSSNVFADLGLPDPELLAVKSRLASALRRALAANRRRWHEFHSRTAVRLGLTPAAYDQLRTAIERGRQRARAASVDVSHVPLDTYVRALAALGHTVTVDVGPSEALDP